MSSPSPRVVQKGVPYCLQSSMFPSRSFVIRPWNALARSFPWTPFLSALVGFGSSRFSVTTLLFKTLTVLSFVFPGFQAPLASRVRSYRPVCFCSLRPFSPFATLRDWSYFFEKLFYVRRPTRRPLSLRRWAGRPFFRPVTCRMPLYLLGFPCASQPFCRGSARC